MTRSFQRHVPEGQPEQFRFSKPATPELSLKILNAAKCAQGFQHPAEQSGRVDARLLTQDEQASLRQSANGSLACGQNVFPKKE
jgi:hypothetical protein